MSSMTAVCQETKRVQALRANRESTRRRSAYHVQQCIERADNISGKHGHKFYRFNSRYGEGLSEQSCSPKLSAGGQYYLDCLKCGRTIFEDGTGTATERGCD